MDPQYTPMIIPLGVQVMLFGILAGLVWSLDRKQSESNAVAHDDIGKRIERMETRMVERFDKIESKLG